MRQGDGLGRLGVCLALLLGLGGLAGCTDFRSNAPIEKPGDKPDRGYTYRSVRDRGAGLSVNSEKAFVVLAFSGTGTRASALSLGVLDELRRWTIPVPGGDRPLTEEVDIVTGTGDGSFAAAYFAAYGDAIFQPTNGFSARFLERDFDSALSGAVKWNLLSLSSGGYNRSDLGAEILDDDLFNGVTYGDLERRGRPFLILNAQDTTKDALFAFTQDQFDLLCSTLDDFPVARAVLASTAAHEGDRVIRLRNYHTEGCPREPAWIGAALRQTEGSRGYDATAFRRARLARQYRDKECFEKVGCTPDHDESWYVHLADATAIDPRGLAAVHRMLTSRLDPDSLLEKVEQGHIQNILILSVNASSEPDIDPDQQLTGPDFADLMEQRTAGGTTTLTMGSETLVEGVRSIYERTQDLQADRNELLEAWRRLKRVMGLPSADPAVAAVERHICARAAADARATNGMAADPCAAEPRNATGVFPVWLGFDRIKDANARRQFKSIPPTLEIEPELIDDLRELGAQQLRENRGFQNFAAAIGARRTGG